MATVAPGSWPQVPFKNPAEDMIPANNSAVGVVDTVHRR